MTARSEDQLFGQYRKTGDPDLLGQVFDLVAPKLLHTALHLARDPAQAEDLLQATFVTAIQKAGTFDSSRPLLPWLSGILTRHAAKARERAARLPDPERLRRHDGEDPVANAEGAELVETLRLSVQSLPDEYRQVLLLKLLHGLAPAEIAEVLGVPPGTVRMRLHRALEKLRSLLPLGVILGLTAGFAPRGLAEVRSAVLKKVPVTTAAVASIGGALMLKKLLASSAIAAGLLATWFFLQSPPPGRAEVPGTPPGEERIAETGEPVRTPDAADTAPTERSVVIPTEHEGSGTGDVLVTALMDGEPVPHVGLTLTAYDGTDPLLTSKRGVAGADGTVLFEGVSAGRIEIQTDRGRGQKLEVIEDSLTEVTMPVDRRITIDGRVVDPSGVPVPNASIWVIRNNDGTEVAKANNWGEFQLRGLSEINHLGATASGYAPSYGHPVRGYQGVTPFTIPLRTPASSLSIRAVDSKEFPLPDALVLVSGGLSKRVSPDKTLARWAPRRHWTDSDGATHIDGLPAEWVQLTVRAADMAPLSRDVLLEEGHRDLTLVLANGTDLKGTVRSPDGKPIVGADVLLEGYARYELIETQTARDGSYLLQGITTDRIRLVVSAEGFGTHSEELVASPGSDLQCDVELERVKPFRLQFVGSNGEPLASSFVMFSGVNYTYMTDGSGRLEEFLEDEQPRTLSFSPDRLVNGWIDCTWLGQIHPREEEIVVTVPDEAMPQSSISGRLAHTEYQWASLTQHLNRDVAAGNSPLNSSREFNLGPLAAGFYTVQLIPRLEYRWALPRCFLGPFQIGPGQHLNLGEIRLPEPGRVQLQLRRIDDVPVLDPHVFFFDSKGREIIGTYVDEDGHASASLEPDQYTVRALVSNASWVRREFEIRPGEVTELELSLQPAVRRYIAFPVPAPEGWEEVKHVDYVLRNPAGEIYDEDDFDPRKENPRLYIPAFAVGRYTLDLTTDTGMQYRGAFQIPNLDPSHVPIKISVSPVR